MKQTFTHSSICFTLRRIWKFPTLLPGLFVLLLTLFTACGGDDGAEDGTYAVVEAASFTFNENDPTKNVIQVLANTEWTVYWTPETSGVSVSPATGSGNGSFYVADMPAGQTLKFGVKTASGKAVSQFATVTRSSGSSGGDDGDDDDDTPTGEIVFSLDFGNGSSGVWADLNEEWKTQTGSGASTVFYNTSRMRINNDNFGSSGRYAGASGKAYAKIFTDGDPGYFTIRDITLPAGQTAYTLTFGTIFPEGDMNLEVSADGSSWKRLTYKGASAYNTWTKASVGFTLTDAVPSLSIRYSVTGVQRKYGLSFDDVELTTGGGGQEIDLGSAGKEYRWAELPANWVAPTSDRATISGDYAFYTHWTRSVRSNKVVRNYSYCYDTRRHNPIWVAYPMHAVYGEGGFGRTSPDPWAPDPALDEGYQSKIYRSDGPHGSDSYQYWSTNTLYNLGLSGDWTRGHLCMSRERGGPDTEINRQTFYPTNIAPQPDFKASTFGKVWGCIEAVVSGTNKQDNDISADDNSTNMNIVADTLFVVAGCYYAHDNWTDYDSSDYNQPTPDPNQKLCVMPTHQYKVLLRTRSGNTGKPIQECSASELQCVGFWVDTFTTRDASSARDVLRQIAFPVSEIEQQTGLTFFPDVPASVKEQCNPADWGF